MNVTRRHFLRNTAASGAVAVAVAVPVIAEAHQQPDAALDQWTAFVASLGDRVPEGGRVMIFGSATNVRAEILVTSIEQVHPNVAIPVDRSAGSYRLKPEGWVSEDRA